MPPPVGFAYFPGIEKIVGASVTMVHGISPAVFQLQIAPQDNFTAAGGTFSIVYSDIPTGGGSTLQYDFPDCKVDRHSFRRGTGGELWTLDIWDRRWKWAFGHVSGIYNTRDDQGEVISDREKTPKELIRLCLEGMLEDPDDAILSDVPDDPRPLVEWDYEYASEALASLCDTLGLRVVLQLDNRVAIRVAGEGADLPSVFSNGVVDNSLSIDPPERPDSLLLVGGINRYQVDIPLEAVGQDTDGSFKLVDDLSYAPADGWEKMDLPIFLNVDNPGEEQDLAQKWIWRAYRIKVDEENPLTVPGFNSEGYDGDPITDRNNVLPIFDTQVVSTVDRSEEYQPAIVYGKWLTGTDEYKNNVALNTDIEPTDDYFSNHPEVIFQGEYTIDREQGLVLFRDYVYANSGHTEDADVPTEILEAPAELWLRTSVVVRDPETLGLVRYTNERDLGSGFGTGAKLVRQEDIIQTFLPTYTDADFTIGSVTTNTKLVDDEAAHYLDAAERGLALLEPQTIKYAGILDGMELDGAITQVTFAVGRLGEDGKAVTIVSRNDEQVEATLGYDERRRIERLRRGGEKLDVLAKTKRQVELFGGRIRGGLR